MDPLVSIRGIHHRFESREVLSDVDWTIRQGEHQAILGPNGAGKTTLVSIGVGYEWPSEADSIRRFGSSRPNLPKLWRRVCWLNQKLITKIPPGQSVRETVLSGLFAQTRYTKSIRRDSSQSPEEIQQRIRGLASAFDLEPGLDQSFGSLSQGEKQLVLICRALMPEPELLVLDEPTVGLDPGAREQFINQLRKFLNQTDTTLIQLTHQPETIVPEIDNILLLKEGSVLARGPLDETLSPSLLEQLYNLPDLAMKEIEGRRWFYPNPGTS